MSQRAPMPIPPHILHRKEGISHVDYKAVSECPRGGIRAHVGIVAQSSVY